MESETKFSAEVNYIPIRVLDKMYYVSKFSVTKKGGEYGEDEKLLFAKNNAFLMILDRSGSMSGGPWKALVEGAKQVATRIYELNEFKMFQTFFFNNLCTAMPTSSLVEFNDKIDKVNAQSKTDFVATFKKIISYCDKQKPEDLTILFLTDGNDTCNKPEIVQSTLNELKQYLRVKEISSRFFTIGLSSDHDSVLLSKVAQAGSDLGNFFYVNYNEDNGTRTYKDTIKECLVKTFDLGIPGGSLNIELNYGNFTKKMYLSPLDQESEENKLEEGTTIYETSTILDSLPEGELELKLLGEEHSMFVLPVESQDIEVSTKLKAESSIINQIMFDSIQKVINASTLDATESKQIYEKLQVLDSRVTEMIDEGFKIRNKENRKNIIQSWQAFKDKLFTVIETLRDVVVNHTTMDLTKVAKLNDLAYKAIRSKGLKRKLDERALKNEEHYKSLEKQIQKKLKEFDFNKIAQDNQEVIDMVGDCPLTCLSAVEALQEGDCLGIWLDVARSEAAIADPSQLVVKDVIPTFMSCSAYLESAAYNLERQSTAHGTFDKNAQGSLATGIGRENVTGILPLFLFNEHWEIAKRTLPSIFGFMWTLDIMGYSEDQFYIIPYTVYFKWLEKVMESPSDVNKKMLNLVQDTCIQILKRHEVFAGRIKEKLKNFEVAAVNRTKDCIPNFKVFMAQVLCSIEAGLLDKSEFDWIKIFRFLIEEGSRRLITKETEVPSKKAQWDYFNGKSTTKIVEKAMEIKNLKEGIKMTMKEILEKLNGEKADNAEEVKKIEALVDDEVESQPWYERMKEDNTPTVIGIQRFHKSINKSLSWIKVCISNLKLDAVPVPESMKDLTWFSEDIIPYAMLFQNMLHPSNKSRREAIESNQYSEIVTKEDAEKYLKDTYRNLLSLEISGEESRIIMLQNADMYANIADTSLLIKDIPTFVNLIKGLKVGDGGVANLIKSMIKNTTLNPFEKLKVILNMKYDNKIVFTDNYKVHPGWLSMKSSNMYKLFIRYCHNSDLISRSQFIELFSKITEEKMEKWIKSYNEGIKKGKFRF